MPLNVEKARQAIADKVARPLGVDVVRAAWGIHQVVNENMANAARIHLVEKGRDPRDYSLIAFGGAGPVHAHRVAERLKLKTLVCPLAAGVTSAFGMLTAPLAFDFVQSYVVTLSGLDFTVLERMYADMEQRGRALLETAGVTGEINLVRSADMRYLHQGFEIRVPLPIGRLAPEQLPALRRAFNEEYERLYKRLNPGVEIEVVNWRLIVSGPPPFLSLPTPPAETSSLATARKGARAVYLPEQNEFVSCDVYDRYTLPIGATFEGPAIVEERECAVVLGVHTQVKVDREFNLIINLAS